MPRPSTSIGLLGILLWIRNSSVETYPFPQPAHVPAAHVLLEPARIGKGPMLDMLEKHHTKRERGSFVATVGL
jgi:hypothetical protein